MNEIRQQALRDAAKDVCMYCSRRAPGAGRARRGPSDSGNWVHDIGTKDVLCPATSILNRLESETGPTTDGMPDDEDDGWNQPVLGCPDCGIIPDSRGCACGEQEKGFFTRAEEEALSAEADYWEDEIK